MRFTNVALLFLYVGWMHRVETALCISKGLLWGSAVSFSLAPLFDVTVYARMRAKNHWTMLEFWAGNVILHFLPLYVVKDVRPHVAHAIVAACIHIVWVVIVSRGTWSLSHIYVPLPTPVWVFLLCTAFATELNTWDAWGPPKGEEEVSQIV